MSMPDRPERPHRGSSDLTLGNGDTLEDSGLGKVTWHPGEHHPPRPSVLITDLELLHAGLGVLMAHYLTCHTVVVRRYLALRISRQLRIIAEHRDLPDWGLRPLYRTMAARWQVRATHGLPCPRRPSNPHPSSGDTLWDAE